MKISDNIKGVNGYNIPKQDIKNILIKFRL